MPKIICKKCGSELPEESKFCQYCGSSDVEEVIDQDKKNFKRCMDCGKELPIDSDFCQFCGSKRVAIVNNEIKNDLPKLNSGNYKTAFIISLIIAICAIYGTIYYASMYSDAYNSITELSSENQTLSSENSSLKTKLNAAEGYQTKSSYYDVIKNNATSKSVTNFFATQTVLKSPNKSRVVFYIPYSGRYTISWSYSPGITITTGNTSSGLVYADITYSGKGVGTIECTNNVNSSKITIYCIGS